MIDQDTIKDLASRLAHTLPGGMSQLKQEAEHNFQSILQAGLGQLNLVTREEFDTQSAVLQRLQERLRQLEQQVDELESPGPS